MVQSGFFNSVGNDRLYDANDISNYLTITGDGIVSGYLNELEVGTSNLGSQWQYFVGVKTGKAYILGRYIYNPTVYDLQITWAGQTSQTITIYAYCDTEERRAGIWYKVGTDLEDTSVRKEIALARVSYPGNSAISSSNITDYRSEWASFPVVKGNLHQTSNTHTRTFPSDFTYNSSTNTYDFSIRKDYFNPSTDDCIVSLNGCILQRDRQGLSNALYYYIDSNGSNNFALIKISYNDIVRYMIANNHTSQMVTITVIKETA